MRTRRMSPEHQEAAALRLSQLSDQLEAGRSAASDDDEWWSEHTRPVLSLVPEGAEPAAPPRTPGELLPHPGRHASRRPGEPTGIGARALAGDRVSSRVQQTLRGRVGLGPTQVAVVAVLCAIGALVTAWLVVRADPDAPVPLVAGQDPVAVGEPLVPAVAGDSEPPQAQDAGQTGAPGGTAGAATGVVTTVVVDVAGKVRRPGIVELDEGARVVDALERAGGARPGVDLTSLNLARVLVDGEQIVVGPAAGAAPAPAPGTTAGTTSVPSGSSTALVDLNLATQAELEELPDVGPVTASSIISWREENGGFSAVTELLEVDGIGDVTLSKLAPLVTV